MFESISEIYVFNVLTNNFLCFVLNHLKQYSFSTPDLNHSGQFKCSKDLRKYWENWHRKETVVGFYQRGTLGRR